MNSKYVFWFATLIWNFPMAEIGLIVALICKLCGCKIEPVGHGFMIYVGSHWGGFELGGMFAVRDKTSTFHVTQHEYGHMVQQMYFGPLQLFLVCIPSAIRYWYFRLTPNKKHPDYDSIWFEKQATKLGEEHLKG